jgi:hypothetical protein
MSLSTTASVSHKAMRRRSMLSSFYDGFIDDLSFFLMCLWFRATPHLLHPTPFTKHHSICYGNSFCLRTIHAMCTFAFVRPDSLASKENQPKLTYYHYLPHICRNLGRFRQPIAFGALSLTMSLVRFEQHIEEDLLPLPEHVHPPAKTSHIHAARECATN